MKKLLFFVIFAFAVTAHSQSDLQPYRNKTSKQITDVTHLQRMDTTFFRVRIGDKVRDLSSAIERRALTPYDLASNNLIAAKDTAVSRGRVLVIPKDFPASTLTFKNQDSALVMVNYATVNITASDTIPAGASIVMAGKGRFNVSSGTLTFAKGSFFDGGLQRRFLGAGTVKFDEGVVDAVRPQWWGAVGDSSTASLSGFQKALNSGIKRIRVKAPAGTYMINDSLRIPSNVELIGENTTIVSTDTNNYIFTAGPQVKNIKISGLTTRYRYINRVRQPNTSAIFIRECDTLSISNNKIYGAPGMGIQIVACKAVRVQDNWVERTLSDGIHITNGLNTDTGRNLWSQDFVVTGNTVINTGDDHIACTSYQQPLNASDPSYTAWTGSQEINRFGVISDNIVRGGHNVTRSRGISVLGGRDIVVANNVIEGRSTVGDTNQVIVLTGILIQGGTTPYKFHRPKRITVANNIIKSSKANHFGTNFEAENAGIKVYGADSVDVIGNMIDWSPFMWGIFVRGDTTLSSYGYNDVAQDVRIIDNTIHNARFGIRLLSTDWAVANAATGWINRVTIRGNRLENIQRYGITADSVRTLFIEDNEFIGLNAANQASIDGIMLRRYGGDVVIQNNKFIKNSTGDTLANGINALVSAAAGPVVAGASLATLYMPETSNIFTNITITNANYVIPSTITTVGLFEYGAVDYLADTVSTTTTYRQFAKYQNRPRSTTTVSYAADSLKITNAGTYRVSGHIICASADSNDTITLGVSVNNATVTDDALTVSGYLNDSSQFFTIPFNFYITLTARSSIKPKFKIASGTSNIYIRRGWITIERLN